MSILFSIFLSQSCGAVSLFDETVYRSIVADHRAYLPGDLLTVLVLENSNAQTSADLASAKEIQTGLNVSYNKHKHDVNLKLSGKGRAAAKTGRNGKIKAALTVRIKDILPNSNYAIEGTQSIQINGEKQTIVLCGVVRPEDISPQNTILSTRIADAQITYAGDGSVSNAQRYNYIYKVLSFMGLV